MELSNSFIAKINQICRNCQLVIPVEFINKSTDTALKQTLSKPL